VLKVIETRAGDVIQAENFLLNGSDGLTVTVGTCRFYDCPNLRKGDLGDPSIAPSPHTHLGGSKRPKDEILLRSLKTLVHAHDRSGLHERVRGAVED
jgi:hypothetical protein